MKPITHLPLIMLLFFSCHKILAQRGCLGANYGSGKWNFEIEEIGNSETDLVEFFTGEEASSYYNVGLVYSFSLDSSIYRFDVNLNHLHRFNKIYSTSYLQLSTGATLKLGNKVTASVGVGSSFLLNISDKLQVDYHFHKRKKFVFGYYFLGGMGYNFTNNKSIDLLTSHQYDISRTSIARWTSGFTKDLFAISIGLELRFTHRLYFKERKTLPLDI